MISLALVLIDGTLNLCKDSMMKKPKLGSGKRFAAGAKKIQAKEGLSKESADAIMANAGRKKYGAKKMSKMASAGKKK